MPFSTDLPDPPVPANTDLTAFGGFVLNVDHLMSSELLAVGTPEQCWAAFMLWCHAWKQIPAGSLPDDERVLRAFSGAGRRWPKVRDVALRGFVRCADGRLYHRFLCSEVLRVLTQQTAHQARRAVDRERLAEWRMKRRGNGHETRFNGVSKADVKRVSEAFRNGDETDDETVSPPLPFPSPLPLPPAPPSPTSHPFHTPLPPVTPKGVTSPQGNVKVDFDAWWLAYPRKVGKKGARQKYEIARREVDADTLLAAARRYADNVIGTEAQYVCHPMTWLNQGRWQDEEASSAPMHRVPDAPPPPISEMWKDC